MSRPFPGGITDDAVSVAYLQLDGEIVAVDLTTGTVKWRQADAGEPLAAAGRYLLTRRDRPDGPVLELLQAEDGRALRYLTAAQLPGFMAVSQGDALDALLRDTDDGLEIRWKSSRRYQGGAMPGMGMAAGGGSAGAVLLEAVSGEARTIAAAPAPPPLPSTPITGDAHTIAAARVGDAEFALKSDGGRIRLEARSPGGAPRWSTALGESKPARPGPLRQ